MPIRQLDVVQQLKSWLSIEKLIRNAEAPDAFHLIHQYLELGSALCQGHNKTTKIQVHKRMYDLLVEVICDVLLPGHWREYCLDMLYQPCHHLQKLMVGKTQQSDFLAMHERTKRLCKYFI